MAETVMFRRFGKVDRMPRKLWEKALEDVSRVMRERLAFMTAEHHRVRNFVVEELPRAGVPLTPERIAAAVSLPVDRVIVILQELERRLTFLVRNRDGAVSWAFPVTVERTPHALRFSSGERCYAA